MKVARLADGSAWALTSPAAHAALVQARLGGPAGEHRELLSAYCLRGGALEGADRKTPGSLSGSLLPTSDPASASEAAARRVEDAAARATAAAERSGGGRGLNK